MMKSGRGNYKSIEAYIAAQLPDRKKMLEQLRHTIREVVPDAEEVMSYQIPCYKFYGMLVGFGVNKSGCSFYTMNPSLLGSFSKELKDFKFAGSTIHFDTQKKLPVSLIKKLIRLRIVENEERNELKKHINRK